MSSENERDVQLNRARRHFLGLTAATSARVAAAGALAATVLPPSVANALGKKWWKKGGGEGGAMCFLRGTSIATTTGAVLVEDLKSGDLVETVRGQAMPVKWIGHKTYKCSGASWKGNVLPVRVARHALDEATPSADLYLSPGHALLIDGVLIQAQDLVNGTSIAHALPAGVEVIEYFHIVLDTHEAIFAEGAAAETFLVRDANHEGFSNFGEFAHLAPAGHGTEMTPCAPTVGFGGRLHLKALLELAVGRKIAAADPVEEAYDRIALRALQMAE